MRSILVSLIVAGGCASRPPRPDAVQPKPTHRVCTGDWCWDSPAPAPGLALRSVWGSGPDDVWAVGEAGTILHWDGQRWSGGAFPPAFERSTELRQVTGTARDDVWAVGLLGVAIHYDGKAWSMVETGTTDGLLAVAASAAGVWVGGEGGLLMQWNGRSFEKRSSGVTDHVRSIALVKPGDVWVSTSGELARGDGVTMRPVPAPASDGSIVGLWTPGNSEKAVVWLARQSGGIHRFEDPQWVEVSRSANGRMEHISGSVADGSERVIVVGWGGIWIGGRDGGAWEEHSAELAGGALFDRDRAIAVGLGEIHVRDRGSWKPIQSVVEDGFDGIWGSGARNVWAVGGRAVFRYDGTSWRRTPLDDKRRDLHAVWGTGFSDVWIGGSAGTILHWDGVELRSDAPPRFNGDVHVIAGNANEVWFATGNALWQRVGKRWRRIGQPGGVRGLAVSSRDQLAVVTQNGLFWRVPKLDGAESDGPEDLAADVDLADDDGKPWTPQGDRRRWQADPRPLVDYLGVWIAPDESSVVVVGPTLEIRTQNAWRTIALPAGMAKPIAQMINGPDDVWVMDDEGHVAHWDGSWKDVPLKLRGLRGMYAPRGGDPILVAGFGSILSRRSASDVAPAYLSR